MSSSWMDKYKKYKKDFNKKDYHGEDPSEVNEYDEYDEYSSYSLTSLRLSWCRS